MPKSYLFTSESVSEGHPDKVADRISDSVLDAMLEQDPASRVACETMITTGMAVIAGEITSSAVVDFPEVVRGAIADIGYNSSDMGFDYDSCAVVVSLDKQPQDIAQGVNEGEGIDLDQGAGDQGLMFGFAVRETETLMPAPVHYSHRLGEEITRIRKDGEETWLRPDSKTQVALEYVDGKPSRIVNVVVSTQHSADITTAEIREILTDEKLKDFEERKEADLAAPAVIQAAAKD